MLTDAEIIPNLIKWYGNEAQAYIDAHRAMGHRDARIVMEIALLVRGADDSDQFRLAMRDRVNELRAATAHRTAQD